MPELYKRNPNTTCAICSKPLYRRPAELIRSNQKAYCSPVCYGLSCRNEVACTACGTLILAARNAKTCSRKCANTRRKGMKYKQGRPKKDKVKSQRAIKLRVIQQRGAACQRCSYAALAILHIHHKDRNRMNNALENLELICPNCHAEEHYLKKSWLNDKLLT